MAIGHGDYFQFEYVGFLYGQTTINTFAYQWWAGDLAAELPWVVAESAVDDQLRDLYLACLSNQWQGVATRIHEIGPLATQPAYLFPMTALGMVDFPSEPPSVAGVISKRTSIRGPRGRGRVFLPAVPTDFHIEGRLSGTGVGVYNDLGLGMTFVIPVVDPAGELRPVVYSKEAVNGAQIIDCRAQPILRNQRRRQIGVGI